MTARERAIEALTGLMVDPDSVDDDESWDWALSKEDAMEIPSTLKEAGLTLVDRELYHALVEPFEIWQSYHDYPPDDDGAARWRHFVQSLDRAVRLLDEKGDG